MYAILLLTLLRLFLPGGPATQTESAQNPERRPGSADRFSRDRQAILLILKRQTVDWNAGRVERFMNGYWPSDSLTFVGKAGITYGYKATLANYQKRYPDQASMGTLNFDILHMDFPAPNVAYVIGGWHLTRPKVGDAGGHFTLLWRKIKNRWVIVSDHSS